MLKLGDQADMYHAGTKNWYRVRVEEGPLTYEQVVGPDFSVPEEFTDVNPEVVG